MSGSLFSVYGLISLSLAYNLMLIDSKQQCCHVFLHYRFCQHIDHDTSTQKQWKRKTQVVENVCKMSSSFSKPDSLGVSRIKSNFLANLSTNLKNFSSMKSSMYNKQIASYKFDSSLWGMDYVILLLADSYFKKFWAN